MASLVLSIATRPDCLPDDVVEYLAELNQRTYMGGSWAYKLCISQLPI